MNICIVYFVHYWRCVSVAMLFVVAMIDHMASHEFADYVHEPNMKMQ